jgi:hypothetical protein
MTVVNLKYFSRGHQLLAREASRPATGPLYVQCQLISIMVMLKSRLLISIFAGSGMAG